MPFERVGVADIRPDRDARIDGVPDLERGTDPLLLGDDDADIGSVSLLDREGVLDGTSSERAAVGETDTRGENEGVSIDDVVIVTTAVTLICAEIVTLADEVGRDVTEADVEPVNVACAVNDAQAELVFVAVTSADVDAAELTVGRDDDDAEGLPDPDELTDEDADVENDSYAVALPLPDGQDEIDAVVEDEDEILSLMVALPETEGEAVGETDGDAVDELLTKALPLAVTDTVDVVDEQAVDE